VRKILLKGGRGVKSREGTLPFSAYTTWFKYLCMVTYSSRFLRKKVLPPNQGGAARLAVGARNEIESSLISDG
jgi:hypothetical protein